MEVLTPANLAEALAYLDANPDSVILAGGTDLLVKWKEGKANPSKLVSLQRVKELTFIREVGGQLILGALNTHGRIAESEAVFEKAPILAAACAQVGAVQIRNRGTLGGNLVTASPAGDTIPALFALGATLNITSLRGQRSVPVKEFFLGPGKTLLQPGELVTGISIPAFEEGEKGFYRKLGQRKALAIAIVSVAVKLKINKGVIENIQIACGSVGPTVVELKRTAQRLIGCPLDSAELWARTQGAGDETSPISDIRASGEYRREMVRVLLYQGLYDLLEEQFKRE